MPTQAEIDAARLAAQRGAQARDAALGGARAVGRGLDALGGGVSALADLGLYPFQQVVGPTQNMLAGALGLDPVVLAPRPFENLYASLHGDITPPLIAPATAVGGVPPGGQVASTYNPFRADAGEPTAGAPQAVTVPGRPTPPAAVQPAPVGHAAAPSAAVPSHTTSEGVATNAAVSAAPSFTPIQYNPAIAPSVPVVPVGQPSTCEALGTCAPATIRAGSYVAGPGVSAMRYAGGRGISNSALDPYAQAAVDRLFSGAIGGTERSMAAEDLIHGRQVQNSPQWQANYLAALSNNLPPGAARAYADQRTALDSGNAGLYARTMQREGQADIDAARQNAASLAYISGHPEVQAPFYDPATIGSWGPVVGAGVTPSGDPVYRFGTGAGGMSDPLVFPKTAVGYGMPAYAQSSTLRQLMGDEAANAAAVDNASSGYNTALRTMRALAGGGQSSPEQEFWRAYMQALGRGRAQGELAQQDPLTALGQ